MDGSSLPAEAASFQPTIVDETSPPEHDAEGSAVFGGGKDNNKKGKKLLERKEQVPIEELYDLSKPIKRIDRPSKESHEAEIATIDAEIESIRADRKALQNKIDAVIGGNKQQKNSPLGRERDALNKLKNRKGLMVEQKRHIRTRLENIKADSDRLNDQTKNTRSGMKFTTVVDIEKEISRLRFKQETSSMSLADEKRLIREIETLQASKRTAEELQSKKSSLESIKEDRKTVQAELNAKSNEIDAIQKEIDAQSKVVQDVLDKQSSKRDTVDDLIKQREDLKAKMDEMFKEKSELRIQFHEKTNDWYNNQRAIKAQKQMEYETEKKRREEQKAEWLKKVEEEELAKTPYEEEMALCDYLANFLTKTYLADAQQDTEKVKAAEERSKSDVVAVKDDPFAGFKAVNKKSDDVIYFGKAKGAKSSKPKPKKASKPVAFSINLDLFDQFGMLSLNPPTSLEAVSASVEELKSKKQWYSKQPRGSVPTARDIRKANEEAGAKLRSGSSSNKNISNKSKGATSGKNKGNFDITTDEFVPLGIVSEAVGGATTANWGKSEEDS